MGTVVILHGFILIYGREGKDIIRISICNYITERSALIIWLLFVLLLLHQSFETKDELVNNNCILT